MGISRTVAAKTFALRVTTGSPSVSFMTLVSIRALCMEVEGVSPRQASLSLSTLDVILLFETTSNGIVFFSCSCGIWNLPLPPDPTHSFAFDSTQILIFKQTTRAGK